MGDDFIAEVKSLSLNPFLQALKEKIVGREPNREKMMDDDRAIHSPVQ